MPPTPRQDYGTLGVNLGCFLTVSTYSCRTMMRAETSGSRRHSKETKEKAKGSCWFPLNVHFVYYSTTFYDMAHTPQTQIGEHQKISLLGNNPIELTRTPQLARWAPLALLSFLSSFTVVVPERHQYVVVSIPWHWPIRPFLVVPVPLEDSLDIPEWDTVPWLAPRIRTWFVLKSFPW